MLPDGQTKATRTAPTSATAAPPPNAPPPGPRTQSAQQRRRPPARPRARPVAGPAAQTRRTGGSLVDPWWFQVFFEKYHLNIDGCFVFNSPELM